MNLSSSRQNNYHIHQFHLHSIGLTEISPAPQETPQNTPPSRNNSSWTRRRLQQQQRQMSTTLSRSQTSDNLAEDVRNDVSSCSGVARLPRKRSQPQGVGGQSNKRRHNLLLGSMDSSGSKELASTSPTTLLHDLSGELDYQGHVLSRIVRDIHAQHEIGTSSNGAENMAAHGLEMVLSEIRGLRSELKEHKEKLDGLREDVNALILKKNN